MNITRRMSPNRNIGRQGWRPDMVVCHITEGAFDGTISWITNPASQVSYHFVVARDGRIVQAVDICNTAWANGTTRNGDNRDSRHSPLYKVRDRGVNANLYSVSIGFEGRLAEKQGGLTREQVDAAVWLIAHIQAEIQRLYSVRGDSFKFDRKHIVGHFEITPRTRPNCPGPQFPFDAIIQYLHNITETEPLEPEAPCIPPEEPAPPSPSSWAQEAWDWGIANRVTDGTNPQNNATREQTVALLLIIIAVCANNQLLLHPLQHPSLRHSKTVTNPANGRGIRGRGVSKIK